ncbi:SH3 domain-containing protein 19 [Salarias fasciatus]|uniref:SH3 domain-containing protein 19 n=1 Tax=Salarias fasciatus TaxID=181472 RepID=UPI00117707FB|nr:SH3 domain-containing protein 19 [Salarias fasciatus]XP_029951025.1 SH3 domain-containing protein 19 [Salarias fasciatus]
MNNGHSQRNIKARIQAFESQAGTEEDHVYEVIKPQPQPRPRTGINKPPVAAKPSVALKPQLSQSEDDINHNNQNIPNADAPQNSTAVPRPQPPKKPAGFSIKEELETLHSKGALPNGSRHPVLTRANRIDEDDSQPFQPPPPTKAVKEPLKPNLNINNHNSASTFRGVEYGDSPIQASFQPQRSEESNGAPFSRESITKRPTTIRVPSRTGSISSNVQDNAPPLPSQRPVGSLVNHRQSLSFQDTSSHAGTQPSLPPRRHTVKKPPPPRPPPAKAGPGRPPAPNLHAIGRSQSAPWETSPAPQVQRSHMKGPVLPPRPNPGHRLYNKYTLQLPHGIASLDYNGSNTGELSFQKNDVLLLLDETDHDHFECQVGETRGRVHKSRLKVITPLDVSPSQGAGAAASGGDGYGLKVQAVHDFSPEGPGELGLRAGDVVTMVEQVDSEWYKGTCRGSAGFFPINYVKVLSNSPRPLPERKPRPLPAPVSGPRCVARFDFEGEHSDELSFSEGDVIQLKEYMGQEWARGQIGGTVGIFPLNFVEIVEDLPPAPSQQQPGRIALPGMVAATPSAQPEVSRPAQEPESSVEWAVAQYDYTGKSDGDLSFKEGDCILITQHVNAEWSCGRLNGREGMFPTSFVKTKAAHQLSNNQQNEATRGGRARALYSYTSDCDEELSLQVGDIITNLESVDDEWYLGDLRGKRAMVPKNYVQMLV